MGHSDSRLLAYYEAYQTRNPVEAAGRLRQLSQHFRGWRLVDIDSAAILGYTNYRKTQGRANATINADLAVLRKTLGVSHELGKLAMVRKIRMLRPAPPRAGFFEADQFERVCQALPEDLALVARIGYTLGWRLKSEVLMLRKSQVDLVEGALRLDPGMAKNGEARVAYLTPELKAGVAEQLAWVTDLERRMGAIVLWLFPYLHGRHIGERIQPFRKPWAGAWPRGGLSRHAAPRFEAHCL